MRTKGMARISALLLTAACFSIAAAEVSEEKEAQARALLEHNGIEHEGKYFITRYLAYENGGGMISVQQIHEELVVFDSELAFHFIDDGELVRAADGSPNLMGMGQDVDNLEVDRDSLIGEQEAVVIFSERTRVVTIPSMTGDGDGGTTAGPKCAQDPESISAELGIYKQKVAWRVMCKKRRSPVMYIDAVEGRQLMFDSGIRS
jgi:hypothetical protein